ncbi:MAG: DUF1501 domain-containing protein [Gemmataceae bacterium]|nr:DUF1501 domain-containing protein [Gemmataceae bacterium]
MRWRSCFSSVLNSILAASLMAVRGSPGCCGAVRWHYMGWVSCQCSLPCQNTGWDTHVQHFPRLREELGPGLDHAFTALVSDLEARGMLEDTAIAVLSEHGRTPRVQDVKGGGRDHWSLAYSALFAGAGFARGRVVGRTDKQAGRVTETPVSPKDVLSTLYHLMGIDPATEIRDRLGRPYAVGGVGKVRSELLA